MTGDNSRVVGYGSWLLNEGEKNNFIKQFFSDYVINVCKKSISAGFNREKIAINEIPEVFYQPGACFVTLEKHGNLRGCIGSIIAHRALIDDLVKNAQNSAFSDPRFSPLTEDEFNDLEIDVSLLSAPEKMEFEDEADLLSQIRPYIDGIIIKDRGYQAVYLPSVWEQLPEKEMFLNSLKIKAGLPPKHFSSTFEAYRFTTEYIKSS
ncbi:MAG: AmmeMemoRadiSam system protein A [Candidatus Gastranaerophilales bacterium]|nr:AmmeMemoRadiSam system protein A [Candidatus Gastranaerophilales bacterium]